MFNLDKAIIDFECPNCGFYNWFNFKEARLQDVIICRGCKSNIHLVDKMYEFKIAKREIDKSLKNLFKK